MRDLADGGGGGQEKNRITRQQQHSNSTATTTATACNSSCNNSHNSNMVEFDHRPRLYPQRRRRRHFCIHFLGLLLYLRSLINKLSTRHWAHVERERKMMKRFGSGRAGHIRRERERGRNEEKIFSTSITIHTAAREREETKESARWGPHP